MKSTFQTIEGTNDLLPGAQRALVRTEVWRYVERVIHEVMHRHGFSEIRTPILEPTGLVARAIGQLTDIVSKEMFTFERGDTSYVLRPELTAPIMRSYLQHHLEQQPGVQRLYYIGACFRAERPQKGRYRQFHQFGAEIIGTEDPRADADIIAVMMEVYWALELPGTKLIINTLGSAETRPKYREALVNYLEPHRGNLTEVSRDRLSRNPLRILDTKVEAERKILEQAPRLHDYLDEKSQVNYEALKRLLESIGITYVEDPMLVRGLDYYTRTAFELEHDGIGAQSALAGGGRYDLLSPAIGAKKPVPAVGFAAGIERLILAMEGSELPLPEVDSFDVWMIALGDAAGEKAFAFVQALRRAGVRAGLELTSRSMKAQMRLANRANANWVVILAEQEMKTEKATVKNMVTGEQTAVQFSRLTQNLTRKLK
ncbi:MAG: histidine--tRNA ligase [Bacteroidota bacterium]|nr:histidine--tRNA ligase [Bacteroidota bacterium]MDE2646660.1 histidine--tRNA ligase [Bacteroidota bacterium]MXW15059.1 histidine--tRNA ligase [Rhodothermaceae bacterium]MYC05015.1 histidine--tRNA ligase [Rhodothermaceae bacterium]MYI17896.1 histidine--tRNA ligase [Rhodothermaceae bacterium]